MVRRGRKLAFLLVAGLPLAACSLGAKQALATRVSDSARIARSAGSAVGTVSLAVYVTRSSSGPASSVPPLLVGPLPFAIDFTSDRAEVGADPKRPGAIATVVFAGTAIYQRRTGGGAGSGAALLDAIGKTTVASMFNGTVGILTLEPPGAASSVLSLPGLSKLGHPANSAASLASGATGTARGSPTSVARAPESKAGTTLTSSSTTTTTAPNPVLGNAAVSGSSDVNLGPGSQQWFQYSFNALPSQNVPIEAGALGINPVLLLRLLHGALAGSIRDIGPATVDGVRTTEFFVNLDPSQTVSDLPSSQQDDVIKQLAANGVSTGGIIPSQVWLGAGGRPKRIRLFIPQFIDRGDSDVLIVTMDLTSYDVPVAIGLPGVDEVAQVQSFGQLIQTVANG